MNSPARFRVTFEEEVGEFLIAQPKRKRRKLIDITYAIAASPFATPDYTLPDAEHRNIGHVATEGYVISYWVDALLR